jgi:hypothetical protein
VPAAAVPVVTVKVELAEPPDDRVVDVELNVQLAFVGQPATPKPTVPLKLFTDLTVTVEPPDAFCASVSEVGLAEMEKSGTGGAFTVPDTVIL